MRHGPMLQPRCGELKLKLKATKVILVKNVAT